MTRVYVSGLAGRLFVVDDGEIATIRQGEATLVRTTPAHLCNALRLYPDIQETPPDLPTEISNMNHAWLRERCAHFVIACVDDELPVLIRAKAAALADRLMSSYRVNEYVTQFFLNSAPPSDADIQGAKALALTASLPNLSHLLHRIDASSRLIRDARREWRAAMTFVERLDVADAATAVFDQHRVLGKLLTASATAFDDTTRDLSALYDPAVQGIFVRWARGVMRMRFVIEMSRADESSFDALHHQPSVSHGRRLTAAIEKRMASTAQRIMRVRFRAGRAVVGFKVMTRSARPKNLKATMARNMRAFRRIVLRPFRGRE